MDPMTRSLDLELTRFRRHAKSAGLVDFEDHSYFASYVAFSPRLLLFKRSFDFLRADADQT